MSDRGQTSGDIWLKLMVVAVLLWMCSMVVLFLLPPTADFEAAASAVETPLYYPNIYLTVGTFALLVVISGAASWLTPQEGEHA